MTMRSAHWWSYHPLVAAAVAGVLACGEAPSSPLEDDGSGGPPPVPGPLVVRPTQLAFGNVRVGTARILTIEVTNHGPVPAPVDFLAGAGVSACGSSSPNRFCLRPPAPDFVVDERFAVAPGDTVTLEVEFRPTEAHTQDRGAFTLAYCAEATCEIGVSLMGTSVESGLHCDRTVDFETVFPGERAERIVTCSNIANEPITVTGAELDAVPSSDFSAESPGRVTLEPADPGAVGGTVEIPVAYAPAEPGDDQGTLVVNTAAADGGLRELLIPVMGTGGGPAIEVSSTLVDFGLASLIAPSRRTVVITNTGFADLQIDEIIVDSDGSGAFISDDAGADIIPPGGSKTINIDFQPRRVGPVETRVIIRSSDLPGGELVIVLRGEGIDLPPCDYAVSTRQVDFGVVEVNRVALETIEVRNQSEVASCAVTALGLRPESDPEFSLLNGPLSSVLIGPGERLQVDVEYAPRTGGQHTGVVELSISNPDTPFSQINLVGTATN